MPNNKSPLIHQVYRFLGRYTAPAIFPVISSLPPTRHHESAHEFRRFSLAA